MQGKLIIITGPTASGKTGLAVEVAKALQCSIINADSRQVYQELNIGVAKPTIEQLQAVKHYFINTHSIKQTVLNAADFASQALEICKKEWETNPYIVLSGGTGFYIRALLHPLDAISVDPKFREQVNAIFLEKGIDGLRDAIEKIDITVMNSIDSANTARMRRCLELLLANKWHAFKNNYVTSQLDYKLFALNVDREKLYHQINTRVDEMINQGLELECKQVKDLLPIELKTVGYTEFFDFFEGKYSHAETIEKIKQHTRNYAKRQITYIKNQFENVNWIAPISAKEHIFAKIKTWE